GGPGSRSRCSARSSAPSRARRSARSTRSPRRCGCGWPSCSAGPETAAVEAWEEAAPDLTDPATVAFYDELPLWSAPFGLVLLDTVRIRTGLTVLDVGCGTGFPLLELAERLGPEARLHGVDPWVPAMERLQAKVEAWKLGGRVTLHVMKVESLELPPESIDLVVSNNGLNNVADLPCALSVCARLARPGAQLVFT